MSSSMNWIVDEFNNFNPPVNLTYVEQVSLGTDCSIKFSFQNSAPVFWRFSEQNSAADVHADIIKKLAK